MKLFAKFWISIVAVTTAVLLLAVLVYAYLLYNAQVDAVAGILSEQSAQISSMINTNSPRKDVYATLVRFCLLRGGGAILYDRVAPENSPSYFASPALQDEMEGASVVGSYLAAATPLLHRIPAASSGMDTQSLLLLGRPMPDGRYLLQGCYTPSFVSTLLSQARILITILLIGLGLATLLSSVLARAIVSPIQAIDHVSRQIAMGNFTVRTNTKGRDEIASLGSSIDSMSEQLQKTDNFKNEIISNVSHNLKTPIAAILTYAELLHDSENLPRSTQQEFATVIANRAHTLESMVKSLILLSKIQTGVELAQLEPIRLETLCREVLDSYDVLLHKKSIRVRLESSPDVSIVTTDRDKLYTVLSNLLSNAVNHSFSGGEIVLRLDREADGVRVTLRDQGEGIHQDDLPFVWDRFYRSPNSRISREQGSGIGMHIVKSIFDLLGYPYELTSELHKGTTVSFLISDSAEDDSSDELADDASSN